MLRHLERTAQECPRPLDAPIQKRLQPFDVFRRFVHASPFAESIIAPVIAAPRPQAGTQSVRAEMIVQAMLIAANIDKVEPLQDIQMMRNRRDAETEQFGQFLPVARRGNEQLDKCPARGVRKQAIEILIGLRRRDLRHDLRPVRLPHSSAAAASSPCHRRRDRCADHASHPVYGRPETSPSPYRGRPTASRAGGASRVPAMPRPAHVRRRSPPDHRGRPPASAPRRPAPLHTVRGTSGAKKSSNSLSE